MSFLKWAGSKKALCAQLLPLVPSTIDTYYEPFLGAGAMFFALCKERPEVKSVLSDSNSALMGTYAAVMFSPEAIMARLARMPVSEEAYYAIRDIYNETVSTSMTPNVETAAQFIYLNRTTFNGLYRVNKKGDFNSPFGGKKPVDTVLNDKLKSKIVNSSVVLETTGARLADFDFRYLLDVQFGSDDFVYLDPPYVPVSKTANFTAYGKGGFGGSEQLELFMMMGRLRCRGVKCLLTNSDCQEVRDLYKDYRIVELDSRRSISSDKSTRGLIKELAILNY